MLNKQRTKTREDHDFDGTSITETLLTEHEMKSVQQTKEKITIRGRVMVRWLQSQIQNC